ncbi:hypothetical protein B7R54_06605 [Subtercola boreus]|uniref:LysM domain-containing protein n=1 Tax=Subtercola boreus TaxID=120213 RepID=A0A3E0VG95_9MICO|nr:LysM peptidoglycan-binding domain-containing protein [Subtercola boreus]RFA08932.1 hypothetical protein B7R54_06605 [Subtercola boreus]TQL54083.1 LysM domain-containing protein [Subtercola boreus]
MTALHITGTPAPRLRLRLTRRGRVVLTTIAALPLVAAIGAFALLGGGSAIATAQQAPVEFSYVTVQSGQSLWSVASQLDSSADTRDVIADLVSLNQLPSSEVQPGQRLAVPIKYEH